eukprot:symbB.v1.2.000318.t2/scaffold6.1/size569917/21
MRLGGWAQALQPFRTTLEVPLKWVHLCAPLLSQPCFGNRKLRAWGQFRTQERIQVGSTDYDDLDAEGAYGRSVADVLAELHDLEQALPNSTRLLIGGFSQGAAIALECALKYPKPLAGCIVVAGWARPTVREFLAEGSTSKTQTPFLLCHGEADDMVDVNCSRILKDLLSKKGAEVQLQTYPGIQHESCPELLNAVMEFMCKGLKLPIPTSITWDDSDSESDTAVVYVSKSRLADLQRASSDVSQAALLELVDPTGLAETETLVPAVLHQPDAIMKLPPAEAIKAIAEAKSGGILALQRRRVSRKASENLWISLLQQSAEKLEDICEHWKKLDVNATEFQIDKLNSDEDAFRALLQRCPWGDPNGTAMVARHLCRDPLVAAHQHATKALVRLELAKTAWKLDLMEKMENVKGVKEIENTKKQVALLSKKAIHHLRLFQIEESHITFTKAYYLSKDSLESPDPDLQVLIHRTSKLLAAKQFQFSQSTFDSTRSTSTTTTSTLSSLSLVRKRLVNDLSYTEAQVLAATKAKTLAELSFGGKRFQEELKSFHENSCLVDLILVFLLHQVLPIQQLQKTLGLQVFQVLLDHHVLCEEMVEGMSEEKYCFASVALWPVGEGEDGTDLLLATDFESTCFSDATEPAMYLSQDSLALRSTSPRCPIRRFYIIQFVSQWFAAQM